MRLFILVMLLMAPLATHAQDSHSGPLFMKDMVDDGKFFAPWGVGVDVFTMSQDYSIKSLDFQIPGIGQIDPSLVEVSNDLSNYDFKVDVWLTPFLNVFGLIGRLDADTYVDLNNVAIPGVNFPLGTLHVPYDGTVYGLGANLMYGTDRWFAALNSTWTKTSLSGNFDSSVDSFTIQPRLGVIVNKWTLWAGGMWLDTTEKHSGTIDLPVLGEAKFDVELETLNKWNYALGIGHIFSPRATIFFEYGFGDRKHTLFNFTYRF